MKEVIEFKRQRDIGAIITDAFKFIRTEGKTLGLLILKITGPAMLVVIVSYIYYMQSTMGDFQRIFTSSSLITNMVLSAIIMWCSYIAFYALLYGTVFGYIKNYIENNGNINEDEVARLARSSFWSYAGLIFIVGFFIGLIVGFTFGLGIGLSSVIGVGFLVLAFLGAFLLGIYLSVCLSISFPLLMFERKGLGNAISQSFKLIKNEWWITFATLIIIFILYYLMALIFQLPQLLYYFTRMFAMVNEASMNPYEIIDWISITLSILAIIAQFFLFAIVLIGTAFIYFHLNEKKNFTGTIETIDNLGERES